MSTIDIVLNLNDGQWKIEEHSLNSSFCQLQMGFRSNVPEVIFDNLSFGFSIEKSGTVVYEEKYPTEDIVYRSSNQPFLAAVNVNLEPLTPYVLKAWTKNAGSKYTIDYNFTTPTETDTGNYENSSVQNPVDPAHYNDYRFDENLRQWVKK